MRRALRCCRIRYFRYDAADHYAVIDITLFRFYLMLLIMPRDICLAILRFHAFMLDAFAIDAATLMPPP